jgi:hypothetical protein
MPVLAIVLSAFFNASSQPILACRRGSPSPGQS